MASVSARKTRNVSSSSSSAYRPRRPLRALGWELFISEQIVAAHGGTITVNSRLNEGALFRVCLPLQKTVLDKTAEQTQPLRDPKVVSAAIDRTKASHE